MDMITENKVVPKLRFKEFKDSWFIDKFSKYIKLYRGSSPRPISKYRTKNNGVNWIKIGDTKKSTNYEISSVEEQITFEGSLKSRKVEVGELILANSMSFGKTYKLNISGCIYDGWFVLREYQDDFYINFLHQLLNSNYMQKQYIRFSTGGVVQNISSEIVYSTKICKPNLYEQQKIASFLSAIDEKLQQLTKKKELLEDYKKGIMQKIFFQEIRFKDDNGNSYNDWKKRKLIEIGEIICGKTPRTNDKSLWSGHIQFITPTDITDGNKYQHNVKRFVTENSKIKVLPLNTIVYTCVASIGKVAITSKPATTNQQINALVTYKDYYYELIYYALLYLTPRIKSIKSTTTLPIINKTEFSNIIINIPDASEEQKKVGEFLSAIDKKIKLVNNQLEKTKEFKKGLLQQMFV